MKTGNSDRNLKLGLMCLTIPYARVFETVEFSGFVRFNLGFLFSMELRAACFIKLGSLGFPNVRDSNGQLQQTSRLIIRPSDSGSILQVVLFASAEFEPCQRRWNKIQQGRRKIVPHLTLH